jgi:MFS family permease
MTRKFALLSALYFVQGLPFGFQATALPVLLRERGVSLEAIGLLSLLALPWSLKALAAPFVDRFAWPRVGHRRSWILPMQAALMVTAVAAGRVVLPQGLHTLLVLTLTMNLWAAVMDIAVDGAAVDMLEPRELGGGNAAQVVGYKVGMLTGGGLLVWASARVGWQGLFSGMALLVGVVLLITLRWREPPRREVASTTSVSSVLAALRQALAAEGALWVVALVASYKCGETMVEVMFKPFLVDRGVAAPLIGAWVGTYGMLASITGSLFGGYLATRVRPLYAVAATAAARTFPLAAQASLAYGVLPLAAVAVVPIVAVEHFVHGALTTAMFAFMMERVDRRIGATHYTLLATVEVVGKSPGAWASGFLASRLGYGPTFVLGVVLSVLCLPFVIPLRRRAPSS